MLLLLFILVNVLACIAITSGFACLWLCQFVKASALLIY